MLKILLFLLLTSCATHKVVTPPIIIEDESTDVVIDTPTPEDKEEKILFQVRSPLPLMIEATKVANCVINLKSFQDELKSIEKFDYTNDNGEQALNKLLKQEACNANTYVTSFFAPWRCRVHGYTRGGNEFFINTRGCMFPKPLSELVKTFAHECAHIFGYGHGGNEEKYEDKSAPSLIGELAGKHSNECIK